MKNLFLKETFPEKIIFENDFSMCVNVWLLFTYICRYINNNKHKLNR